MSTILKALKKAEASGEKHQAPFTRASVSAERGRWLLIPVAICIVALGYFLASYIFKSPSSPTKNVPSAMSVPGKGAANSASDLNAQAIALIESGRLKESEDLLTGAIRKNPGDPYLRNHLGLTLKKQDRPLDAVIEYERAIELKPDYYIAMNNLAVALEAAGDTKRAAETYEKALAGDPTMSGAHMNYALLLESQGKLDEAENHYRTFLTLSGDENLKGLVRKRLKAFK